jgi:FkbM family methyltransferase
MSSDQLLSSLTRRFSGVRGFWRIARKLQNFYSFANEKDISKRLETIDDYDGDLKLRLDKGSYMGNCIYWHRYYSKDELLVLHTILEKNMTFFDVGANNGYFTIYAAKRLPQGKVISFEPVSPVFQNLLFNIKLNNFTNITAYNLGLSDGEKDRLEIFTSDNDLYDALSTFYPTGERTKKLGEIKLSALDTIAEELSLNSIDVIKIDVEGAELEVLKGSQRVLSKFKPKILIEINEETYQAAGYTVKDLTDFLEAFGYSFKLIGVRGSLTDIDPIKFPAFCNALCVAE